MVTGMFQGPGKQRGPVGEPGL